MAISFKYDNNMIAELFFDPLFDALDAESSRTYMSYLTSVVALSCTARYRWSFGTQ